MTDETPLPIGVPLIGQFGFMQDCVVKIPVSIKEKQGQFFMKLPVQPEPSWKLDLIIRSVYFPKNHPMRLYMSPFGEVMYWNTTVLGRVAHSDYAEIHEISRPDLVKLVSKRMSQRFFCLTPVKCYIRDLKTPLSATCVDVSETGIGLKFHGEVIFPAGERFRILFDKPFEKLPELMAKVVRQNYNALDQSTSLGLIIEPDYKKAALQAIQDISRIKNSDALDATNQDHQGGSGRLFDLFSG